MSRPALEIETFVLGPLQTNTYLLRSGGACVVVDPGMDPDPLVQYLLDEQIEPGRIWLTHGHGDHIAGVNALKDTFPEIRLCCPAGEADMLTDANANLSAPFGLNVTCPSADQLLEPGTAQMIGPTAWQVLDTSGHTKRGVSFYCSQASVVLTGDALFASSVGRTDIPGANMNQLITNIRDQLLVLPDDTQVLPGHGPKTTIGVERRTNPFIAH